MMDWVDESGHFFLLKRMRMALMLSMPYWLPLSLEISSSRSYSTISLSSLLSNLRLIHSTISLFVFTYHIPSHPIIINSTFSFFIRMMSGFAVIICYSGFTLPRLYYRSPSARDRFSPPFTRP